MALWFELIVNECMNLFCLRWCGWLISSNQPNPLSFRQNYAFSQLLLNMRKSHDFFSEIFFQLNCRLVVVTLDCIAHRLCDWLLNSVLFFIFFMRSFVVCCRGYWLWFPWNRIGLHINTFKTACMRFSIVNFRFLFVIAIFHHFFLVIRVRDYSDVDSICPG